MDILTGNLLLIWTSFVGQLVFPVRGEAIGSMGWMGDLVILASCEYYFYRVHENLVQHPSNNISILSNIDYKY